jgi:hypothetical protein
MSRKNIYLQPGRGIISVEKINQAKSKCRRYDIKMVREDTNHSDKLKA